MAPQITTRACRAQIGEHGVEDIAADIVEIHVDAVWTVRPQALARVSCLVVDRGVEAEFLDEVAAFVGAARDADRAAALDLRDLAQRVAPTAPAAPETTTVSPGLGWPTSSRPK